VNGYLHFIESEKPDRIMLAAAWDVYDWRKLLVTTRKLKKLGLHEIDLIGPVPRWLDSLPRQMLNYFMKNRSNELPIRMMTGLSPNVYKLDLQIANFSRKIGVNYISPTQILCNSEGCITRLGMNDSSFTSFDSAHFTEAGADYVVSKFVR
jgi:hypothetical protein